MPPKGAASFPTVLYSGIIDLRLTVDGEEIAGDTVPNFLVAILTFIIEKNELSKISIPFKTSGENYLVSSAYCDGQTTPLGRDAIAVLETLEAEVARLREALKIADMAINPPDRGGISLDHWNVRLKNATGVIRAALGNQQ